MRVRTVAQILGAAILFSLGAFSQHKTFYSVEALGTLGGPTSEASAINAKGEVVGFADLPDLDSRTGQYVKHAFLYESSMRDLGTLEGGSSFGYGVNDKGDVVGDSVNTSCSPWSYKPFIYSAGTMAAMPMGLLSTWDYVSALAINNAGSITGFANYSPAFQPFIRSKGVTSLIAVNGAGLRINSRNHVAGHTIECCPTMKAFLYDGVVRIIQTDANWSRALDLNDHDDVVGDAYFPLSAARRGFLYRNGTMRELPSLLADSQATAINNRGEIVGSTIAEDGASRGVIWKEGTPYDVNDLLETNSRSDWLITEVRDINNFGQLAAQGYSPTFGIQALRLTPAKHR